MTVKFLPGDIVRVISKPMSMDCKVAGITEGWTGVVRDTCTMGNDYHDIVFPPSTRPVTIWEERLEWIGGGDVKI